MGATRITLRQEREAVSEVVAGSPLKAVARRWGLPYETMRDIAHRHGVSPKATDNPDRLRLRERWARNQRACRARRAAG